MVDYVTQIASIESGLSLAVRYLYILLLSFPEIKFLDSAEANSLANFFSTMIDGK